ncbi:MAG: hypothetical protein KME27_13760 [Lyngbya sp. HA4199-MV5]|jgi:hypothetical protein|nr:hypothetical protein [Lyngbya sp. HA4199-MV5]
MSGKDIQQLVQYVTDSQGTQTGVVVPIALWEKILEALDREEEGLSSIDEDEPKGRILADLEDAVRSARSGMVYSLDQLWDQVYE